MQTKITTYSKKQTAKHKAKVVKWKHGQRRNAVRHFVKKQHFRLRNGQQIKMRQVTKKGSSHTKKAARKEEAHRLAKKLKAARKAIGDMKVKVKHTNVRKE